MKMRWYVMLTAALGLMGFASQAEAGHCRGGCGSAPACAQLVAVQLVVVTLVVLQQLVLAVRSQLALWSLRICRSRSDSYGPTNDDSKEVCHCHRNAT